jgi:hypothetical protein
LKRALFDLGGSPQLNYKYKTGEKATLTHLSTASVTKRIRVVITLAPGVEVDVGAVVGVGAGRERRNVSPELVGE